MEHELNAAEENAGGSLPRLVQIMRRLLAPGGCPWDREQSLESLRPYVIEEAHEVVDAIDQGSAEALREELGDLLLQIVFQAELARAKGWFGPDDVVEAICEKLIRRHPHVFGDVEVKDSAQVLENWEAIKAREKAGRGALDGVPVSMPALLRAQRVGEKAARIGFDWPDHAGARAKLDEELAEFDRAIAEDDAAAAERELGDVLFSLANTARKRGLDAENALRASLARFTERVRHVEASLGGRSASEVGPEQLDQLWEAAKRRG